MCTIKIKQEVNFILHHILTIRTVPITKSQLPHFNIGGCLREIAQNYCSLVFVHAFLIFVLLELFAYP